MLRKPWRRGPLVVLAVCWFVCSACGYVKAGRWDDDPKNWDRAFDGPPIEGWTVVHSRYWRGAHFTYEFGYFFEVKVTPQWREKLARQPDLIKYEAGRQPSATDEVCFDRPKWFAPKEKAAYEAWSSRGGTGNYRLLIDKQTGEVFFSDCQF